MIHRQDAIEIAQACGVEQRVRRQRPRQLHTLRAQACDEREDDLDFLASEMAGFAGMGIQARDRDARLRQAYRVDAAGNSIPTDEPVSDFSVSNLGVQLRYRYEFAPLSYVYVVYGRGGFEQENTAPGSDQAVRDSFSLRDDEQLLIKVSYRFET